MLTFTASRHVLLAAEFSGRLDTWTEHLCIAVEPDGTVVLSSCCRELLMYEGRADGEVLWPEGHEPDPEDEDREDDILPLSIGGIPVFGRDGCAIVGEQLLPYSDDSLIRLRLGEIRAAREWLEDYGWANQTGFEFAWQRIRKILSGRR